MTKIIITVEYGNEKSRELIKDDLGILKQLSETDDRVQLAEVIVPEIFDDKVNEIQGTSTYKSSRGLGDNGIIALAKTLHPVSGPVIVINPELFKIDVQSVRAYIYLHEYSHLLFKSGKYTHQLKSPSEQSYMQDLEYAFEEYWADQITYSLMHQLKFDTDAAWLPHLQTTVDGFISTITDPAYIGLLRDSISKFRVNSDVSEFLVQTKQVIDPVFVSIVHMRAILSTDADVKYEGSRTLSPFITDELDALIEFFHDRCLSGDFSLEQGLPLIRAYFYCFGFEYEDVDTGGIYCHVLDV